MTEPHNIIYYDVYKLYSKNSVLSNNLDNNLPIKFFYDEYFLNKDNPNNKDLKQLEKDNSLKEYRLKRRILRNLDHHKRYAKTIIKIALSLDILRLILPINFIDGFLPINYLNKIEIEKAIIYHKINNRFVLDFKYKAKWKNGIIRFILIGKERDPVYKSDIKKYEINLLSGPFDFNVIVSMSYIDYEAKRYIKTKLGNKVFDTIVLNYCLPYNFTSKKESENLKGKRYISFNRYHEIEGRKYKKISKRKIPKLPPLEVDDETFFYKILPKIIGVLINILKKIFEDILELNFLFKEKSKKEKELWEAYLKGNRKKYEIRLSEIEIIMKAIKSLSINDYSKFLENFKILYGDRPPPYTI